MLEEAYENMMSACSGMPFPLSKVLLHMSTGLLVKVICSRKESSCICLMAFKENIPKSDKGTSIIRHHGGLHLANAT